MKYVQQANSERSKPEVNRDREKEEGITAWWTEFLFCVIKIFETDNGDGWTTFWMYTVTESYT